MVRREGTLEGWNAGRLEGRNTLTRTFQNCGDYPLFDRLPAFPPSRLPAPRAAARGYTLAALMVFVTLVLIGLTAGFQLWSNRLQRENEDELIFRGKQYVEALRLFQQRWGRPPTKLKELMEIGPGKHRCIRQLWKDPHHQLRQMGPHLRRRGEMARRDHPRGPRGRTRSSPGRPPCLASRPAEGWGPCRAPPSRSSPSKPPALTARPRRAPSSASSPLRRRSPLRAYNGRRHYCEWEFSPMVGTPGAAQGGRPLDGGQGTGGVEQPPK